MRLWMLGALVLAGCGGPNRVAGTVAGKSWNGDVKKAVYCEDCGGGPRITVVFQRENELATMLLEIDGCTPGATESFSGTGGARLSWFEHPNGKRIEAKKGEVEIQKCTSTQLDASFSAELSDGGSVSGRLSTPLERGAGYE